MSSMLSIFQERLAQYNSRENSRNLKRASVLIPVFERQESLFLLLTQRSLKLRSHAGQVSFPGGKADAQDLDGLQTALREAREEIGLRSEETIFLGKIDQILSRDYYLVTPFIVLIPAHFTPTVNLDEIDSVFEVPLEFFTKQEYHKVEEHHLSGNLPFLSHHFYFQNYDIWGLTAMLILRLLTIGLGYSPPYPVHHPESPTWMEMAQNFTGKQTWNSFAESWRED